MKTTKTSVRIVGVPVGLRTRHLQNLTQALQDEPTCSIPTVPEPFSFYDYDGNGDDNDDDELYSV
jgi:hypothetical protein